VVVDAPGIVGGQTHHPCQWKRWAINNPKSNHDLDVIGNIAASGILVGGSLNVGGGGIINGGLTTSAGITTGAGVSVGGPSEYIGRDSP